MEIHFSNTRPTAELHSGVTVLGTDSIALLMFLLSGRCGPAEHRNSIGQVENNVSTKH
jgi:hypothetical protein